MELLYLVGTIWSILLITLAMCLDTRRPMSTKLKYKYRVKDNSIFRKIIKYPVFIGSKLIGKDYFQNFWI